MEFGGRELEFKRVFAPEFTLSRGALPHPEGGYGVA